MAAVNFYKDSWSDLGLTIPQFNEKITLITHLNFLDSKVEAIFHNNSFYISLTNHDHIILGGIRIKSEEKNKDSDYVLSSEKRNLRQLIYIDSKPVMTKYFENLSKTDQQKYLQEKKEIEEYIEEKVNERSPVMERIITVGLAIGVGVALHAACPPLAIAHRVWRIGAYIFGVPTDPVYGIPDLGATASSVIATDSALARTTNLTGQTPHIERAMHLITHPHLHVVLPEYEAFDPFDNIRDFGGAANEGVGAAMDAGVSSPDISLEQERA